MQKTILFNLLGVSLDSGFGPNRWNRWRPSVAICQHEDLIIDEYNLIFAQKHHKLAELIIKDIKNISPETRIQTYNIDFNDPWDFEEVYAGLHDYLKQYNFHNEQTEYLFNITTGTHVAQICIFLLTEARYFPGKLIQTSPVNYAEIDQNNKNPAGAYAIIDLDLSKYERIVARFAEEIKNDISFLKSGIETRNKKFNQLIEQIELVALRSIDPILLTGPTGAGKSSLAAKIYQLKKQHSYINGPFVEVNCATLRGDASMSTLFGHKKGSFTGAINDRSGLLKTADKGILFLDEIGELGLDEQAMLLRAIEEKKFMSVGADQESESEFQLICGTNRNLKQLVKAGRFREDLLARINLWTFELPGIKERLEDIEPNINYELNRYAEKTGNKVVFNKETRNKFLNFASSKTATWTANFRDLNGTITRMCTLAVSGRINDNILNDEIKRLKNKWKTTRQSRNHNLKKIIEIIGKENWQNIDPFDKYQLIKVIKTCLESRSLSDAGRKLFSISRLNKDKTNDADRLRKYLARFNLEWKTGTIKPHEE